MSEIALWLIKLGLEKYISAFAEADIDFADLPSLTGEDLKEVGLPVGPRRRVHEAIKSLDNGSESNTPEPEVSASKQSRPDVVSPPPSSDAERWHLTVMFVDLVGSTEMATRMTPSVQCERVCRSSKPSRKPKSLMVRYFRPASALQPGS